MNMYHSWRYIHVHVCMFYAYAVSILLSYFHPAWVCSHSPTMLTNTSIHASRCLSSHFYVEWIRCCSRRLGIWDLSVYWGFLAQKKSIVALYGNSSRVFRLWLLRSCILDIQLQAQLCGGIVNKVVTLNKDSMSPSCKPNASCLHVCALQLHVCTYFVKKQICTICIDHPVITATCVS